MNNEFLSFLIVPLPNRACLQESKTALHEEDDDGDDDEEELVSVVHQYIKILLIG